MIPTANHTALLMPARGLGGTTPKVVSVPRRGEGGIPGSTIVMDEKTGSVKAMMNARSLTPFRNAAGSLLSARIVRLTDPTFLVAFGSGSQIHAHLSFFTRSYPSLNHVTRAVRSPNARSPALTQSFASPSLTVTILPLASPKLQSAISSAQLIICATSATDPLFPSSWVRNGTYVILIGSYTSFIREVERASRANALLVDSKEACVIEARELIEAGWDQGMGGEEGEGEITMFKSVGVGLQDVAIACEVVRRAEKMGAGTRVEGSDKLVVRLCAALTPRLIIRIEEAGMDGMWKSPWKVIAGQGQRKQMVSEGFDCGEYSEDYASGMDGKCLPEHKESSGDKPG
ncbi:hypothetical protein DXG01_012833 [Tephrocybe rancida]|nr:hypothetical protein DXG01_012833 [Tephrocybe rancida]